MRERRIIPFRWLLPVAELVVCVALLWPWRGFVAWQLRAAAHAYWPNTIEEPVHLNIDLPAGSEIPKETRAGELSEIRLSAPTLLNLPCTMLGLLRRDAVPQGMLPEFWRSLSWPFLGMVFWWIAGRGIDALVGSRSNHLVPSITWMEVLASVLEIAPGIFIWGLFLSGDRSGFVFPWPSAIAASTLWILLGGATIAARAIQWRLRRMRARNTT